jgi:hypothetical protein
MKFFNILVISTLTFFCISTLNAEIYTWTDDEGVKHYSDTPPENEENYKIHKVTKTFKYDEEADKKRTEADQKKIRNLLNEDDENDKKQRQEKRLKAQKVEKDQPPTQEEKIAAEKNKLEEKISFLEGQPFEYFGNELNKHRYVEHYRSRLKLLQQNPNKYFKMPDTWQGNIKIPD